MAQITTGLRSILSVPWIYNLWLTIQGGKKGRAEFMRSYLKIQPGESLFDIGCGTGTVIEWLPEGVKYVGFDVSEQYVNEAREKYGDRAEFVHAAVGDMPEVEEGTFDWVLALGVLHHLDDSEAEQLFEIGHRALKPSGRLLTLDGVYDDSQSKLARWLVSQDRGQNIRTQEGYEALARPLFDEISSDIWHNMTRIPYTRLVMTCRKSG